MADNKFFYNTNYKGQVENTAGFLTGTANVTISGNANNIITYDVTFSDDRANGLTFFFSFGGVSGSDFINGTVDGNAVISGSNTVSITRTLDSENATATGINLTGRVNSTVGKLIVQTPVTNIVEVDGPKIAGVQTSDGKANLTIFTSNGDLQIQSLSSFTGLNKVRALVVGGGGATGHRTNANTGIFNAGVTSVGGGGGGEVVNSEVFLANTANVPVTVGVGGSFDTYANSDGRDSSIDSGLTTIVANGGGGGGCSRSLLGTGEPVTGGSNVFPELAFISGTINGRDGGSGGGGAVETTDTTFISGSPNDNIGTFVKGSVGNSSVTGGGQGNAGGLGAGHGRAGLGGAQPETINMNATTTPYNVRTGQAQPSGTGDVGNTYGPLGGGGGGGAASAGGVGPQVCNVHVLQADDMSAVKTGGDGGDGVSYTIFNQAGNTVFYGGGGGGGPSFVDLLRYDFNEYLSSGNLPTGGTLNFATYSGSRQSVRPANISYRSRPGDPGAGGSSANIGGGGSVQFLANIGGKELHEQVGGAGTVIVRSKLKYKVFQA